MPKVEYSKSKGLVQSTGSGFVMVSEAIVAAGALDPGVALSLCTPGAGSVAYTLADGDTEGQLKWIVTLHASNDSVVTPVTTAGAYTTITLGNAGESVCLAWTASGWVVLSRGSGAAAAAGAVAGLPVLA